VIPVAIRVLVLRIVANRLVIVLFVPWIELELILVFA
jgi:hypothetical protein